MTRHDFPDAGACAAALAGALADAVADTLNEKPRATLALSGGRSPEKVLPLLAAADVEWRRVDVTLIDERRVTPDAPASNAGLVHRCFMTKGAEDAVFHPLWTGHFSLAEALEETERKLARLMPVDVAYIGMGPDGHIASLFPADDASAFDVDAANVIATEAPAAPRDRVSLTLSALLATRCPLLHVTGAEKIAVLEKAARAAPTPLLPVSLLLHARPDLEIFACAGSH